MMGSRVILASNSPRRLNVLTRMGLNADVFAVHINEAPKPGEKPLDYVRRMAREKMIKARHELLEHPKDIEFDVANKIILTADTIGTIDGRVLTKPKNKEDAFAMWRLMSGRSHEVVTSVCLSKACKREDHISQIEVTTEVFFITLNEAQMQAYWDSGEPVDKAGGYAIQGRASAWVEKINGSYFNVVGLPAAQTLEQLALMERVLI